MFLPNIGEIFNTLELAFDVICRGISWTQLVRDMQDVHNINETLLRSQMMSISLLYIAQRVSQSHQAIGKSNLGLSVIDKLDLHLPKGIMIIIQQIGEFIVRETSTIWILPDPVEFINHIMRLSNEIWNDVDYRSRQHKADAWWIPRIQNDPITKFVLAYRLSERISELIPEFRPSIKQESQGLENYSCSYCYSDGINRSIQFIFIYSKQTCGLKK